jgi:hypothetical protein
VDGELWADQRLADRQALVVVPDDPYSSAAWGVLANDLRQDYNLLRRTPRADVGRAELRSIMGRGFERPCEGLGLLGDRTSVQVPTRRGKGAVTHDGLNAHEIDPGGGQE